MKALNSGAKSDFLLDVLQKEMKREEPGERDAE